MVQCKTNQVLARKHESVGLSKKPEPCGLDCWYRKTVPSPYKRKRLTEIIAAESGMPLLLPVSGAEDGRPVVAAELRDLEQEPAKAVLEPAEQPFELVLIHAFGVPPGNSLLLGHLCGGLDAMLSSPRASSPRIHSAPYPAQVFATQASGIVCIAALLLSRIQLVVISVSRQCPFPLRGAFPVHALAATNSMQSKNRRGLYALGQVSFGFLAHAVRRIALILSRTLRSLALLLIVLLRLGYWWQLAIVEAV
jgi:hypothetical protein